MFDWFSIVIDLLALVAFICLLVKNHRLSCEGQHYEALSKQYLSWFDIQHKTSKDHYGKLCECAKKLYEKDVQDAERRRKDLLS